MSYAGLLQDRFPGLNPVVEDLYLLEAHQIANLPERAPAQELAAVLHAHPSLRRFFITRHPPIEGFLAGLLTEHSPVGADELMASSKVLLWEIADWIVYQRAPGAYDTEARDAWDVAAVTDVVALQGKVVIDAGAGTGRVAFSVAPIARHVYAIEPVAALREYMRDRVTARGIGNLFVLDGFLHAIPLPARSADVLLTCQAVGWTLPDELAEIERVVKPGGTAMHLLPDPVQSDDPLRKPLVAYGYLLDTYQKGDLQIVRYRKQVGVGMSAGAECRSS